MDRAFLGRGRSTSVQLAPPQASDRTSAVSSGFVREISDEINDVFTGRLSLLMLNTLVLALVVFYIWTRNAQGGG